MASFAKLGANGEVLQVIAVDNSVITDSNGIEQEKLGINFLTELYNWPVWKQTSYNTSDGSHKLGGTPFRKNHAAIGYTYDIHRDAFIPEKPFASWILNEATCQWKSPVEKPVTYDKNITDKDGNAIPDNYKWNETTKQWDLNE